MAINIAKVTTKRAWEHVTFVESDSEVGKEYEIKKHAIDGRLGCSCLAYRFMKGFPKSCKHLRAFQQTQQVQVATVKLAKARKAVEPVREVSVAATVNGETFKFRRAMTFGSLEEALK